MTMYHRRKSLFSGKTDTAAPLDFLQVVKPVFEVIESVIEVEPEPCFAIIVSNVKYDNPTVTEFISNHSGVPNWYVVPGYPFLNENNKYQWRCTRVKDW